VVEVANVAWWLALPAMFVVGGSVIVQWTATNTLVQSLVADEMRGRVMSIYAVVFFAGAPLGALFEGVLASSIGQLHTFAVAGIASVICAVLFRRTIPA
jgi:predicted MFS family arabinose efflux permease